ncbi:arsenate reductase [Flavobacteriaceae bacterium MAR_2010_72]|nr:arsenate reductase [Flavobacteriaceae bacterium MAR_2010_72]TVZ59570.1 arsenate reductase [Flavobacteriaceae bacterium MAR_2010_105]
MIKIYHNPRCSKSREGLQILEESNNDFKVVKYLENPFSVEELKHIISLLGIKPIELVRTNEALWKTHYKTKKLSDAQVLKALVKYPKLIERPIVVKGNKAVIGRPPEKILDII